MGNPSINKVLDHPEAEWHLWLTEIADKIEDEGRMDVFKAEGTKRNKYREKVVDYACIQAIGDKNPATERVFLRHGVMVARMFARGARRPGG